MNKTISRMLFLLIIAGIAAFFSMPSSIADKLGLTETLDQYPILRGLDLAGGTELDYEIILDEATAQNNDDDPSNDVNIDVVAESVRDALEKRVNPAGVGEVLVKRSQINGEEHVLIQLPPTSNVAQAKADAEQDNSLEFFEEDPGEEAKKRQEIQAIAKRVVDGNVTWAALKAEYEGQEGVSLDEVNDRWISEISDPALKGLVEQQTTPGILNTLIEGRAAVQYTVDDDGNLSIGNAGALGVPPRILGIPYMTKTGETRALPIVSHILFGFEGASRAAEDVPYKSAEEAKTKAEEVLAQIQSGADFADLAAEFSTGPSGPNGGTLGVVKESQMVGAFDAALFGALNEETRERTGTPAAAGLFPEIVETEFGYHLINVTGFETDTQVSYETLQWDIEDLNWTTTELGGKQLENAVVGFDEVGQPVVNLLFDTEGGKLFTSLTERISAASNNNECASTGGCRIGIKVGGAWRTQPRVNFPIYGNQVTITGSRTYEEAQSLANQLNLGAIDAPVRLSGEIQVQPELGAEQLAKSLKAGAIGLGLTMLFMIMMYRWAGVIASVALLLYSGLFITILRIWGPLTDSPIVMSLAGVAGMALSIGLAVDGNVLIFERMKEELRRGKSIYEAVELGFNQAWSAIRDSNITTLITCVILYIMGSSIIRGFAVTLIVGTFLSLFTAVYVSRNLLRLSLKSKVLRNPALYGVSNTQKK